MKSVQIRLEGSKSIIITKALTKDGDDPLYIVKFPGAKPIALSDSDVYNIIMKLIQLKNDKTSSVEKIMSPFVTKPVLTEK